MRVAEQCEVGREYEHLSARFKDSIVVVYNQLLGDSGPWETCVCAFREALHKVLL
jgi:hypothetical protein